MTTKKVKKDGTIHISKKEMQKLVDKTQEKEDTLSKITKIFEKDKWVQNEYWENIDGVMCASFINIELDQLSVFIDADLDKEIESNEETKECEGD